MGRVPRRLIALHVLLLGLAAGCAAAQTPAPPPPDKVPEAFPKDCPIYKDATIRDYNPPMAANPKIGTVLVLETTDPKAKVMAFYRRELPASGWKLRKQSSKTPDFLEATKDGRLIKLTVLAARQAPNPSTLIHLRALAKD